MRSLRLDRLALALAPLGLAAYGEAAAEPDFSGVWGMVQHDRLGAPFFIPIEPKLNAAGQAVTQAFVATEGAGLISQLDQSILRRVADLSF